jgi:hypothetical protein
MEGLFAFRLELGDRSMSTEGFPGIPKLLGDQDQSSGEFRSGLKVCRKALLNQEAYSKIVEDFPISYYVGRLFVEGFFGIPKRT